MGSFAPSHLPFTTALLITALLASSCSSDSSTGTDGLSDGTGESSVIGPSNENSAIDEASTVETGSTGSESNSTDTIQVSPELTPVDVNPLVQNTTLVNFDITVPVYVSDTLQVRLVWGDQDITASWVSDESWAITDNFPTNTENQLVITFNDENGAITLGSFETAFKTGNNASQSFRISADQFNTTQWDSDNDGVSNLDELLASSNPNGDDLPQPVQANLELVPDKTFRFTWQSSTNTEFYRVLENPDGISGFTDISGELEANTTNFDHRVALYSRVNAQYLVQSCNDRGCVDSAPVIATGTLANTIGYFKASNTEASDLFGTSVALSADGNTLAVGASGEDSAATGINVDQGNGLERTGAVYIFFRNNGQWQQQAYVKASDPASIWFGGSISLSADGSTLIVGTDGKGPAGVSDGAAYVFVRNGVLWQQQALLKSSNSGIEDRFGIVVAISADGNTVAVTAIAEDSGATGINGDQSDNSAPNAGAAYIFVRDNAIWEQQAYLKASNADEGDLFGSLDGLSLSADGNTLAIGAVGEQSAAAGINADQNDNSNFGAGAVYVFVRSDKLWQQQAYIKPSTPGLTSQFGGTVRLSADGTTLAVGAKFDESGATGINGDQSDNSAEFSGAVYTFVLNDGLWQQQAYIKASNTNEGDFFGTSVSLSADGNTLAVGARSEQSGAIGINGDQNDNSVRSGAVYIFKRRSDLWQQQSYLKASNAESGDFFGTSVSLSADGDTLAVGAVWEDSAVTGINGTQNDNSAVNAGAVYLY